MRKSRPSSPTSISKRLQCARVTTAEAGTNAFCRALITNTTILTISIIVMIGMNIYHDLNYYHYSHFFRLVVLNVLISKLYHFVQTIPPSSSSNSHYFICLWSLLFSSFTLISLFGSLLLFALYLLKI